ncbi:DUF6428 family protein [Zhouia amylolytica]|uniref:DUF6428 family protein n=1 Tax=Zhouia amylolytica TaxID=376730 RepID=UPI0020CC8E99|nr:DUF6428 family protein [Zhouia amylolytica]MCQ0110172.1 hypothetical protein [Zhouia amylolytica]
MKTSEFISLLEKHPDLPLYFEYKPGLYTRNDYHITEIKNVSFDTVDCGGIQNKWEETHVQLWENEVPEPNHKITTSKALKIFQLVEKMRPTFQNVEVKIEYGNKNFHTAILPVHNIQVYEDKLIVKLVQEHTTCKAKDRATTADEKADACCSAPAKPEKKKIKLAEVQENACSPGNGCC